MEENNQNIEQQENLNQEIPEQLSVSDALTGIITGPGDTFDTIVKTPKKTYWAVPIIITVVVSIIVTFLFFRDEQLISGMMDKQKASLEKRMEEQVKSGKMSSEQAKVAIEQAEKYMDPKSTFFQVIGFGGAIITPFIMLFVLSLVYLIILKIMKAEFDFVNILNVVGLSMIISTIGSVIGLVLSILIGEVSSLSLALVLKESMVGAKLHELFLKLDVFTIWFYIATAIGLSKVARISGGKAYGIVFGIWILWLIITSSLGFITG
ncbi:MAG: Yip1 family protein [Ignavibacteria bacterium]|nr:Yip1 family protein [Ignavibacteria bacterium]